MKCEITRGGDIYAANMEFNSDAVRKVVAKLGGNPAHVPGTLVKAIETGAIIVSPVREVFPVLSRFEVLGAYTRTVVDGEVVYTYDKKTLTVDEAKSQVRVAIAATHDAYERTRVEHRGVWIKFDLEARINIAGIVEQFEAGAISESVWRGRVKEEGSRAGRYGGLAVIPMATVEEAKAVKLAIIAAVSHGFTVKGELEAAVDAATTLDELAAVNAIQAYGLARTSQA